jgi:hypothetical protein
MVDGVLTTKAIASPVLVDYVCVDKHWYRVDGRGVAKYMQRDYGVWAGCRPATKAEYEQRVKDRVRLEIGEIIENSAFAWGARHG